MITPLTHTTHDAEAGVAHKTEAGSAEGAGVYAANSAETRMTPHAEVSVAHGADSRMAHANACAGGAVRNPVRDCDARVKIALLTAFSVGVFFVYQWPGMLLYAGLLGAVIALSELEYRDFAKYLIPVYVLVVVTCVFNVVRFEGGLHLEWNGAALGAIISARIVMLVLASVTLCITTDSSELLQAFRTLLEPLRRLGLPVDDAATTLCLAVRFIPVLFDEFEAIRTAQLSRCAGFEGAGLWKALMAYGRMFIPLFVGMFRHADRLAVAMDARAYGLADQRTALRGAKGWPPATQLVALVLGLVVLIAVAVAW